MRDFQQGPGLRNRRHEWPVRGGCCEFHIGCRDEAGFSVAGVALLESTGGIDKSGSFLVSPTSFGHNRLS